MVRTRIPLLLAAAMLVACTGTPPVGPKPGGSAPPRPKPTPTTAPTATPAATPSAGATGTPGPQATATPLPVPTNVPSAALASLAGVRAGLDAKLKALAQVGFTGGRAQLVEGQLAARGVAANRGASLISDRGGALVANNGGNLISDRGGAFRLLQAALPGIDLALTSGETAKGVIIWPDGKRMQLNRQAGPLLGRTIDLDLDGKAFGEIAITEAAATADNKRLALGYRETELLGPEKAFGKQLTERFELDLVTSLPISESGTARFREPASGVDVSFSKYEIDHVKAEGRYERAIAPYGLTETGTFTLDPARLFFSFTDPLQRSAGEATVKGADGKPIYTRRQTLEDDKHVLVQAFDLLDGVKITFRLDDRVAGEPGGSVTLAGQPVGTATRTVSAAGAVSFAVQLADEPGKPLVAEVAPPAGTTPSTAPAVPAYDTLGVAAGAMAPEKGLADGLGEAARFNLPSSVVVADARTMYVADTGNNRIVKLTREPDAKKWTVAAFAGTGTKGAADGPAATATLDYPLGLALASFGSQHDTLLVTEAGDGHRIRAIALTAPGQPVTTLLGGAEGHADGDPTAARFKKPFGMAAGPDGVVFLADEKNFCIRTLTRGAGGAWTVATIAGDPAKSEVVDGEGAAGHFGSPTDVAYDAAKKTLWVADRDGGAVRAIDLSVPGKYPVRTVVKTSADLADGPAATAGFGVPSGIAIDAAGNVLVADWRAKRVRMITPAEEVRTLCGRDFLGLPEGPAVQGHVGNPWGMDVLPGGEVVFCDITGHKIRIIYKGKKQS